MQQCERGRFARTRRADQRDNLSRSGDEIQAGDSGHPAVIGERHALEFNLNAGLAPLQAQKNAPTRALAEKFVEDSLAKSVPATDANNYLYYVNASRTYNPAPNSEPS